MSELIITIVITAIVLLCISIYFTIKKSALRYIVPIIGLLISFVLIGISFIIDSWEDMGMGAFGFAIFIGSAIAFVITAIIGTMIELRRSFR